MSTPEHEEAVAAFFKEWSKNDPQGYAEAFAKNPTLSPNRIRRLRRRERCVGLLGLQPVALPASVLANYNIDGLYED
jgi:hypothetical protein